jgi:hypothetical protein
VGCASSVGARCGWSRGKATAVLVGSGVGSTLAIAILPVAARSAGGAAGME